LFDIIRLHWEYVISITFPRQQMLRERAQMILFNAHCLFYWSCCL